MLSNYPAADFSFTASVESGSKDGNVEFSTQNLIQPQQAPIDEKSRTVYIDETNTNIDRQDSKQENIYEKVMATTTSDDVATDGAEIICITLSEDNLSESIPEDNLSADEDYQDTHHIEALQDINNPLSPTYTEEDISPATPAQLVKASSNANNSAFLWTFFILSLLIGSYYLFTSNLISYSDIRTYIGSITSSSADDKLATPLQATTNTITITDPAPSNNEADDENSLNIKTLLELAESQINQKKLSTPPSDNALETYRLIISSNPNNEQALAGIKLIKERYQTWAKLDIKDGNSKRAIYFLQRAIEISPDDEALNLLSALE